MRVKALVLVLSLVALSLSAQEYEQLMLPVAPSLVFCAYESRYETRLVAFNDDAAMASRFCADGRCHELQPKTGSEITNVESGGTPLPVFLYVPKETADNMRMSLTVEASNKDHLDERGFTELPIVRAVSSPRASSSSWGCAWIPASGKPCGCSDWTGRCRAT